MEVISRFDLSHIQVYIIFYSHVSRIHLHTHTHMHTHTRIVSLFFLFFLALTQIYVRVSIRLVISYWAIVKLYRTIQIRRTCDIGAPNKNKKKLFQVGYSSWGGITIYFRCN